MIYWQNDKAQRLFKMMSEGELLPCKSGEPADVSWGVARYKLVTVAVKPEVQICQHSRCVDCPDIFSDRCEIHV